MKKEYDFSKAKKNPYTKLIKKQVTINLNEEVLDYFKALSKKTSIPHQTLINFYLLDCVKNKRTIQLSISAKENEDIRFASAISTIDGLPPSDEAERIMRLYSRGDIDYQTAQLEIEKLYKK